GRLDLAVGLGAAGRHRTRATGAWPGARRPLRPALTGGLPEGAAIPRGTSLAGLLPPSVYAACRHRPPGALSCPPMPNTHQRDFTLEPADTERLANLGGPFDAHLRQIELALGVEIANRGNVFRVTGTEADRVDEAER